VIKTITSSQNPLIQRVIKLHEVKYRAKFQEFIAEGIRTIETLIKSNQTITTLFTTEEYIHDAQQLVPDKNIILISTSLMKKISLATTPSNFLAIFAIPSQETISLNPGIVLAQIQDPGNAGTLIRTAVAMNKNTIICVESVDPWNPKVIQASAGTIGYANIFSLSWQELLQHKKQLKLYALIVSGGQNPYTINTQDALLVIGNEAHGIPQNWIDQCDKKITLSMPGTCESFNAAIAGSIALYMTTIKN